MCKETILINFKESYNMQLQTYLHDLQISPEVNIMALKETVERRKGRRVE